MFKRRNSVSLLTKMRNFVWPELGWKRYGQYILMRLNRLKGTPREIAAGVALCGCCATAAYGVRMEGYRGDWRICIQPGLSIQVCVAVLLPVVHFLARPSDDVQLAGRI